MTASKLALMLIAGSLSGAASASTGFYAQDILSQFNLVTLGTGTVTSTSHVDGRTYISGSVIGGDYAQHPGSIAASSFASLTVAGSASNLHVNSGGTAVVLGNLSGSDVSGAAYVAGTTTSSHTGGTLASTSSSVVAAKTTSSRFSSELNGLSSQLSKLSATSNSKGTSNVTISGNKATFNAYANSSGLAVIDLTKQDSTVFSLGEFEFNLNGATTVIINTDNTSFADVRVNFLGGSAQTIASSVIWNFYNATSITVNNQFGGSILATSAHLTNNQNIEGVVMVDSLTQKAEIHANGFTGNITAVPEPETYAMMLGGLALMAGIARRRRAA